MLVTGRTEDKFNRARAALGERADRIAFLSADNADPKLPDLIHQAVKERWGRLDGLLVSVGGPPAGYALTTDDHTWRQAFESIFLGTVRLVRELSAVMSDGGAIGLILAVSAKEAAPNLPISSGLRPGLALLAKNFADELGARNIRVNTLLPNLFATDRVRAVLGDQEPPISNVALKRIGEPAEFARVATIPAVAGCLLRHRSRCQYRWRSVEVSLAAILKPTAGRDKPSATDHGSGLPALLRAR